VAIGAAPDVVAAPLPTSPSYSTTLTGPLEASGSASFEQFGPSSAPSFQYDLNFSRLSQGGLTGAKLYFTPTGTSTALPATLDLPGLPYGEVNGTSANSFDLLGGTTFFSPQYLDRYGADAAPFMTLLQGAGISLVIQTAEFPDGQLRGTLTRDSVAPIPLPAAIGPFLIALAGGLAAGRRKARRGKAALGAQGRDQNLPKRR
jgi:hypothetical protein